MKPTFYRQIGWPRMLVWRERKMTLEPFVGSRSQLWVLCWKGCSFSYLREQNRGRGDNINYNQVCLWLMTTVGTISGDRPKSTTNASRLLLQPHRGTTYAYINSFANYNSLEWYFALIAAAAVRVNAFHTWWPLEGWKFLSRGFQPPPLNTSNVKVFISTILFLFYMKCVIYV